MAAVRVKNWPPKAPTPAADHTRAHTALQSQIVQYVEVAGGWVCNLAGSKYQRSGLPDLIGFLFHVRLRVAVFVAIEVKTGKGALSSKQKTVRDEIVNQHGIYIEARSVDDVHDRLLAAGLVLPLLLR